MDARSVWPRFAWRPGLELDVAYDREVREPDGAGRFAHRWRWRARPDRAGLAIEVDRHHVLDETDSRPPSARAVVGQLRDWPLTLHLDGAGALLGVSGADAARARAGVTTEWLARLPEPVRTTASSAMSEASVWASAAVVWTALVALHHGGPIVLDEPQVRTTAPATVPALDGPVQSLVTYVATSLPDGTIEVQWTAEPDGHALAESVRRSAGGAMAVQSVEMSTTGRLRTDPHTLVPKDLELFTRLTLERRLGGARFVHDQVESRRWRFVEVPSAL